jgi:hypothetical protein
MLIIAYRVLADGKRRPLVFTFIAFPAELYQILLPVQQMLDVPDAKPYAITTCFLQLATWNWYIGCVVVALGRLSITSFGMAQISHTDLQSKDCMPG